MSVLTDTNPLEYISKIQDILDLADYMEDEEFRNACDLAIKCIAKPQIPDGRITGLIVQLQAYSFQFHLKAVTYSGIKASKETRHKKNAYYAIYSALNDLVDALKIQARFGQ